MSTEIPSMISQFINDIHKSLDIPITSLQEIYLKNNTQHEDLYSKKIVELRHLCELRGLTKHGNKHELIEKINSTSNPHTTLYLKSISALKHMCKEHHLKVTGNKHDLVFRLFNHSSDTPQENVDDDTIVDNFIQNLCSLHQDLSSLKKAELKLLCEEKNIDSNGTKKELLSRLNNL